MRTCDRCKSDLGRIDECEYCGCDVCERCVDFAKMTRDTWVCGDCSFIAAPFTREINQHYADIDKATLARNAACRAAWEKSDVQLP